jgi:catechol 2,3-dioxygenase-like lactoylglutathione lyase family enzyme
MKKTALSILLLFVFAGSLAAADQPTGVFVGLAHIQIGTRDLEKSIQFYVDNLGFQVTSRSELARPDGTSKMALVRLGSCILELSQPAKPETVLEKTRGTIGHFAIEVTDIDKAVAAIRAKGITLDRDVFTIENLFGGIRGAFISGPSGESIELFQFMKKQ